MHTMEANTSNVPAFITKLWKLVEDINYDHLICWNQSGRSFIIHDQSKFAKELLPLYFKHSNMASFIRQLNMYGFRKLSNIENSGLRSERDDIEFYNQFFVKGQEYALEFIKRKTSSQLPSAKSGSNSGVFKQEDVSDIISDMESIKGKQDSVDSLLNNMQRENEALWREVAILRQKHHKQQQIVEKLIQFLVTLVQSRGILGIKRKAQLMIDDENNMSRNKVMKTNDCDFTSGDSRGPIIHDVTDDIDSHSIVSSCDSPIITNALNLEDMSPNPQVSMPEMNNSAINSSNDNLLTNSTKPVESINILDPLQESIKELGLVADNPIDVSNLDENVVDESLTVDNFLRSSLNTPLGSPSILDSNIFENTDSEENKNDVKDLVVSKQNEINQKLTPSSLNDHIDGIEAELDWLRDQLSAGGLNIPVDSSTLLGVGLGLTENAWLQKLFSFDETDNKNNSNEIVGNEIVQFNPNNTNLLFDDLDLDSINPTDDSQDRLLMKEKLLPNLSVSNPESVSLQTKQHVKEEENRFLK